MFSHFPDFSTDFSEHSRFEKYISWEMLEKNSHKETQLCPAYTELMITILVSTLPAQGTGLNDCQAGPPGFRIG